MTPAPLGEGDALIVADVQNDFLPGGSLAAPRGDEIVAPLNRWIDAAVARGVPIFATRDWHPPNHCSFREQGGPWPPHGIAGSRGADFARDLRLPPSATLISKGSNRDRDAYSGFQGTDLDERLRSLGVRRLLVGGLVTEYCVLGTVKDARRLGYEVVLLTGAIRALDAHPGDGARAEDEMIRLGAVPLGSEAAADEVA